MNSFQNEDLVKKHKKFCENSDQIDRNPLSKVNLIQEANGVGNKKAPTISFFPESFPKVGISTQRILTFSFGSFATLL